MSKAKEKQQTPPPRCRCGKPRVEGALFCADCLAAYRKLWEPRR